MSEFVTDTHAIYWSMTKDPRLSKTARQVFIEADQGLHRVLVPGIVLIELEYLTERRRLEPGPVERILGLLDAIAGSYELAPLNQDTARAMRQVPRLAVPDRPDRIIVATARQLGLPLISRDEAIRRSGVVPIIW